MRTYTHDYPSDITREQFEIILADLEGSRKQTKPRNIDLYSVFCAILYLVKGGVQWRMLPANFQKEESYATITTYGARNARLERAYWSWSLKKLVTIIGNDDLRKDKTSLGIVTLI